MFVFIYFHIFYTYFSIFVIFIFFYIFASLLVFLLDVTLQFFISHLHFSTCIFVDLHICVFLYFHIFIIVYFHIFIQFCFLYFLYFYFNVSMICVSDYLLLHMWLNVCVYLYVNVGMVFFCACILSYLLWQVSHERQGMLTQWPAPNHGLEYTE